ncbi:MAG TPA: IS982 family transposase, partial [Candidatus Competibacteraceae bacterium]|nr:IS982 family transposase [Candidatus Competibacteraceae bacterium]
MPLEEFIITVFCWVAVQVAQILQRVKLRQRGYAPRLSDTEVIPMEIVGAVLGYQGDEAIWEYFRRHGLPWFPGLGGRTTFSRQAANLWRVKQCLHQRWVAELGAATADGHIIDGFPIPVGQLVRAPRSRVLTAEADDGYGAAKKEYYDGLKGHRGIALRGVVIGITVTAAPVDERDAAHEVLTAIEGILLGDKGYIRPQFKAECEAMGIDLQTPVRRNMTEHRPQWWLRLLRRLRKRIET